MFRSILGHLIDVSLEDVITVHVGHFCSILQPDFVFGVLGEVVEGSDVEGEFAGFGEFAETNTQRG